MVGSALLLAAGFILTASSGVDIDRSNSHYREYTSFLFMIKSGKWRKFNGIEKIFINSAKRTTKMHTAHTNHSSIFVDQEYNGYLKLVEGTKLHLMSSRKKEKLADRLNTVASFLNCPVQDNTSVNS